LFVCAAPAAAGAGRMVGAMVRARAAGVATGLRRVDGAMRRRTGGHAAGRVSPGRRTFCRSTPRRHAYTQDVFAGSAYSTMAPPASAIGFLSWPAGRDRALLARSTVGAMAGVVRVALHLAGTGIKN